MFDDVVTVNSRTSLNLVVTILDKNIQYVDRYIIDISEVIDMILVIESQLEKKNKKKTDISIKYHEIYP